MNGARVRPKSTRPLRGRDSLASTEGSLHHGSHVQLLVPVRPEDASRERMDAIIVPTSRPVDCLRESIRLARELDCPLVALCSKSASALEAAGLGVALDADVLAIGVDDLAPAPRLVTTGVPADPRFRRDSDLSLKRNLGLRLAKVAGWQRVLFLDDDISGARAGDVQAAAALLKEYGVVGLHNDTKRGYPDNSVVCHAYRAVGGKQDSFIGAGAVAIAPQEIGSFFPDVYNEDWFVFHGVLPVAVTGNVVHRAYDPFADPNRARDEEFGDCLAEGLFWLRDEGKDVEAADEEFYRRFLQRRRAFIAHVLDRLRGWDGDPVQRDRMVRSVEAAQRRHSFVTPGACAKYMAAWRGDVAQWQEHLSGLPDGLPLAKALTHLRLTTRAFRSRPISQARRSWDRRGRLASR